ncbi:hypothetical protein J2847_005718 [Azospirillum agricola]|uniref:hypothetical protein n=1 Tax=Azospirillum agricola TaxID=1720247 RepID=UPI002D7F56B6|nr:hypothetical protein [Azospirillum agricola]MBP2232389.1 hypothetical protein [Azospirillum agricola]
MEAENRALRNSIRPPATTGAGPVGLARTRAGEGRDSLHILPLSIIPLETPGLRHARLIKNVRLETVAEVFNDAQTGSGQIGLDQLPACFGIDGPAMRRDLRKIMQIAEAASFDVYSLRLELRRLKIDVDEADALRLSDAKRAELTGYMQVFTRPLIEHVYGSDGVRVSSMESLIRMFAEPDIEEARRRLQLTADRLDIPLTEIPAFLEEYADIFLSLAYFKRCLDDIVPDVQGFLAWMTELHQASEVRRDFRQGRLLDEIGRDLTDIATSITGRFESFDNRSRDFWRNINAESFRAIRDLIVTHHLTIGGVLCGLAVKMNLWKARFSRGGGPVRRLEFIRSEILPGLSHIKAIEQASRNSLR